MDFKFAIPLLIAFVFSPDDGNDNCDKFFMLDPCFDPDGVAELGIFNFNFRDMGKSPVFFSSDRDPLQDRPEGPAGFVVRQNTGTDIETIRHNVDTEGNPVRAGDTGSPPDPGEALPGFKPGLFKLGAEFRRNLFSIHDEFSGMAGPLLPERQFDKKMTAAFQAGRFYF